MYQTLTLPRLLIEVGQQAHKHYSSPRTGSSEANGYSLLRERAGNDLRNTGQHPSSEHQNNHAIPEG